MSTTAPDLVEVPTRSKPLVALITVLLALNSLLMFYVIIKIWPSNGSVTEHFFLFGKPFILTPERRYMLMMPLGGALGASIHLIISFTAFVGNRAFVITWIPWYALRPFVGAGLALFFYLLLRGGILTYSPAPETPATDTGQVSAPAPVRAQAVAPPADSAAYAAYVADSLRADTAQKAAAKAKEKSNPSPAIPLNPYGMMAIACMVGMFSKEAARKLEETFKTVFNVNAEDKIVYADKLPTDPDNPAANGDADGDPAHKTDIHDVLTDADADTNTDTDTTPQG